MRAFLSALALCILSACLLCVTGCEKKKSAPPTRTVQVGVAEVRRGDAPLVARGVGHVLALNTVDVQSQVTGIIKSLHFQEGSFVKRGQLLAEIDPEPFKAALEQAQGTLAKDTATSAQARRDYERYKDLVGREVISRDEYEQYLTAMHTSEQQVKADKAAVDTARINLGYCAIRAPLDGVAGYQQMNAGNTINAYQGTLVSINQVQPIQIRFSVNQSELPALRKYSKDAELPAFARVAGSHEDVPEQGELTAIDNSVDPQTGMITLQAQFPNTELALWPGQFIQAGVTLTVEKGRLLIPSVAVVARQEGNFVFVVTPQNTAELRSVKIGRTVGDDVVVHEGLKPGEKVVTEGLVQLSPGVSVSVSAPGAQSGGKAGKQADGKAETAAEAVK
ncbi:efflux transporter, RND family, MFP subunit [Desulfovibrio sp. X2]|uniref:efflux RND transporter periplasmic adaptor subunit n=1 Tax=Desulfovibrio sp. X2 TaxID=941449 RepID=UPI000358B7E4|nr:efflux RND transporter periplasmic adaptor subunit [Desulfovibrio sp. X2]EPR37332.1 efflux transporter, RND family, MFP subunit [Desulfovibrio sp. X2]